MRVGFNPHKDQATDSSAFFHHVVIPVHIPEHDGYFKEAGKILSLCIESLTASCHTGTFITLVNNGSCTEVVHQLNQWLDQKRIHEVVHTPKIGKVNAVLKGLAGHQFPLLTVSDADVLFCSNWQQATYEVFNAFPRAGAVCTTPLSRRLRYYTQQMYRELFFSKTLRFTEVKNPGAMKAFARSIDDEELLKDIHLRQNLTVVRNGVRAVVGAGHFCCTYKASVYDTFRGNAADTYLGGKALQLSIDEPVARSGYWRLSTEDNYTFHLGNTFEPWMEEQLASVKKPDEQMLPTLPKKPYSKFLFWVDYQLLPKITSHPVLWRLFLRWKGLDKKSARYYF